MTSRVTRQQVIGLSNELEFGGDDDVDDDDDVDSCLCVAAIDNSGDNSGDGTLYQFGPSFHLHVIEPYPEL